VVARGFPYRVRNGESVLDQRTFLFILLTSMGVAVMVLGFFSLQSLMSATSESSAGDKRDPFLAGRVLSALFNTKHADMTLRRLQKRTIWLFCGSMLLFFVARQVFITNAPH
jgi:hypothetical protein